MDKIGLIVVSFPVLELNNAFVIFVAESCFIALIIVLVLVTSDDILVSINVEVDVVSGVFITISVSACSLGRGKIISLPTTVWEMREDSVVATTEVIEEFCLLNRGSCRFESSNRIVSVFNVVGIEEVLSIREVAFVAVVDKDV